MVLTPYQQLQRSMYIFLILMRQNFKTPTLEAGMQENVIQLVHEPSQPLGSHVQCDFDILYCLCLCILWGQYYAIVVFQKSMDLFLINAKSQKKMEFGYAALTDSESSK